MASDKSANRVTFPGSMGQELRGDLHLPAGEPRAFAIVAHCFTCSKDSHAASRISAALTGAGFAVLRFDFTGLGASDGDFADTTFGSNIEDLEAAAAWLADNYEGPQLLVGHSLGGAAAMPPVADLNQCGLWRPSALRHRPITSCT
ncbi:alpha/beta fold hydrolase [Ornithinimicrobium sp. INDO-MA30-4]|uniref:alpha/beta fold hydrolase n=1 Tax=Ornithinimicrobium sp. INDO-MA30-4 TaxID=2908651 RepID=UPI001F208B8C|nr:alpha/beta fold hydrolase [Ornithinimicrobium sp. INDO-MA30-4]UJH71186.1 alpha/beta fold hydrolase [Ornithinimicrobium sp. INDO-MA30-4]